MHKIDDLLRGEIESGSTPGLQYYFFDANTILHRCSAGLASVEAGRPIDEVTSFHGYSVTKTFTAVAVLQLAERGLLDIDQPAIRYYPNFPYGNDITVRQLLGHTAGVPNPIPLRWIHLANEHEGFDDKSFFDNVFAANPKLKGKPGAKFSYTNLGYILLGRIIEQVSGQAYTAYIREHILGQLGSEARNIGFAIPDPTQHATGYHRTSSFSYLILGMLMDKSTYMGEAEGRWRPFHPFYVNGAAYGGLVGRPIAFVRYIQALLQEDGPLLSAPYRALLFDEQRTTNGKPTGMALSWYKGVVDGHTYYCHAGGGGGYYCEIRIYPDNGVGSVVFMNRTGMTDERFLNKPDQVYFKGG